MLPGDVHFQGLIPRTFDEVSEKVLPVTEEHNVEESGVRLWISLRG